MLEAAAVSIDQVMRRMLDPVALMRDAGLEPDDWQVDVLRSPARKKILCCSRGAGKSTVSAALALWHVLYDEPGSLVLLVSPSQRQSGELFKRAVTMLSALPGAPAPVAESALRLELANGNRIVSLPGSSSTIRSFSGAGLIILDEASRCEDELIASIKPMQITKSDSRFVALSTPWGLQGWFHRTWTEGEGWERTSIPWRSVPRITKEDVDDYRREEGETMYRQEFCCEFVDVAEQMFPSELVEAAFTDEVRPLW